MALKSSCRYIISQFILSQLANKVYLKARWRLPRIVWPQKSFSHGSSPIHKFRSDLLPPQRGWFPTMILTTDRIQAHSLHNQWRDRHLSYQHNSFTQRGVVTLDSVCTPGSLHCACCSSHRNHPSRLGVPSMHQVYLAHCARQRDRHRSSGVRASSAMTLWALCCRGWISPGGRRWQMRRLCQLMKGVLRGDLRQLRRSWLRRNTVERVD